MAEPGPAPLAAASDLVARVRFGAGGLVPAVVQDAGDGRVLTQAWMSRESLERTLETGETWFWSRSRQELWRKGATSGNTQAVRAVVLDCDRDSLLVLVDQVQEGSVIYRQLDRSRQPIGAPRKMAAAILVANFVPETTACRGSRTRTGPPRGARSRTTEPCRTKRCASNATVPSVGSFSTGPRPATRWTPA